MLQIYPVYSDIVETEVWGLQQGATTFTQISH